MNPNLHGEDAVPIQLIAGTGNTPSIPYRGIAINLEQNLMPGTQYLLGANDFAGQNPNQKISTILCLLNNITEKRSEQKTGENDSEIISLLQTLIKKLDEQEQAVVPDQPQNIVMPWKPSTTFDFLLPPPKGK